MDPEVKRQFDELHALVKDTHRLLRAVRRHQLLETFGKFVLWIILLGIGGYFYAQYASPFVSQFIQNPSGVSTGLFGLPSSADLQKLIDSYKAKP